jgi:hypothetical protein
MSMPWYMTLVLFALSPLYTMLIRDKLWPKIADLLATRSRSKTIQRVKKLEAELSYAEQLPLLTDFEGIMLLCVQGLFLILACLCNSLAWILHVVTVNLSGPAHALGYLLFEIGICTMLVGSSFGGMMLQSMAERHRRSRITSYRESLHRSIEHLSTRLT